ncbi:MULTISPECIES: hypothetical protein [unclassified Acidovorax]|uniref:hypothetical protein n=1 Tax=unclassified Acidovorax TaxID=2684926 RepID=UPI000B4007AC|nr:MULTISPECIES: hypothetical protein [unclassified Acidovorax]
MDTQHIGKAEVINCEFEYECPLDWFKLATTYDASVRNCGACNKDVYFCRDTGQLVLLLRYIPDACAAMHVGKTVTIDASRIRTGIPTYPRFQDK